MSYTNAPVDMSAEIAAAAAWWRAILRSTFIFDNGDTSGANSFAGGMASLLRMHMEKLVTDDLCARFEDDLVKRFTAEIAGICERGYIDNGWWPRITVGTDYYPDPTLCEALAAAGLPEHEATSAHVLPYKTMMWIAPGKVDVRPGYRAQVMRLFGEGEP